MTKMDKKEELIKELDFVEEKPHAIYYKSMLLDKKL